jgi:hypothetical protein
VDINKKASVYPRASNKKPKIHRAPVVVFNCDWVRYGGGNGVMEYWSDGVVQPKEGSTGIQIHCESLVEFESEPSAEKNKWVYVG